ncbi:dCTP deaminase domain-containing protein [Serpentinicella alkaliphila]|uniref:Deoxycytidine triphosphate deaminase n=1 Tax=Serpentinicella alkaliphila TaxID=1734049 RepID=A0A4R2TWB3_9FIRM|nr:hypothetical protein [Serpentinicella alkaliphila]QUH25557.1 hypothetical protein HZR23_07270 [Serpentinicella alkaliphila]TCQ01909.1 deoxycytidine triphosphate deaminase [Serpentinicella alkaliphila]
MNSLDKEVKEEKMENHSENAGFLSDVDIIDNIKKNKIVIWPMEEKENLTPVGYNLTPTEFIFSINNRLLVNIYNNNNQKYCYVEPRDTVLILTREAVWVSNDIAGTFHSKVGIVSQGFGHISTTLDPRWQGPLLISLNNPTNKRLKFLIAKNTESNNSDDKFTFKYCSFVTLILYKLVTPAYIKHDNPSCRFDLLKDIVKEPSTSLMSKIFFGKKYKSHYNELRNFIGNIGDINFIKLGIEEENGEFKIEEFKNKYDKFIETIKFYTDSAHAANREIVNLKNLKNRIKKCIVVSLSFLPLLAYSYLGWKFGIKNERPSTDGYMMLIYLTAVAPFIVQAFTQIHNSISRNSIKEKGELN